MTVTDAGTCRVSVFKNGYVEDVISLRGSPCALVWGSREGLLVSCGEVLYLVSDGEARPVLWRGRATGSGTPARGMGGWFSSRSMGSRPPAST